MSESQQQQQQQQQSTINLTAAIANKQRRLFDFFHLILRIWVKS